MSDRKLIKSFFQFLFSLVLRNKKLMQGVEPSKLKKVLIIRHDALGDMIITLPSIYLLRKLAPQAEIHILASKRNFKILKNVKEIDKVFIAEDGKAEFLKQLLAMKEEKYSLIISALSQKITKQGLTAYIIGGRSTPKALYFRGDDKYVFFNFQSKIARNYVIEWERMYALFADTLSQEFDIDDMDIRLEKDIHESSLVKEYLTENKVEQYIVINLSAGQARNELSEETYREILKCVSEFDTFKIIFICMNKDMGKARLLSDKNTLLYPPSDILNIAELIRNASLCITPDTSIVHLACVLKIPTIGIYSNDEDAASWSPYKVEGGRIMNYENLSERLTDYCKQILLK